jgi:acetyl esterase/lipase
VKHQKWIFISANYRLLVPTTAHHIVEDIKDLFTYVSQELALVHFNEGTIRVDPKRLAVGGESFGGYCAKLAALHVEPKPKAVITLFGQYV